MKIRAVLIASLVASLAHGANSPPLSPSWNIASTGKASTSGELLFRVTPGDGDDATEVTVFVLSGTNDTGVASNIRRALNSQLRADLFNVEPGEGANVLLSSPGQKDFSLELVDSDVENVRVAVQSAAPVAPPTVPRQATPATPPAPAKPGVPAIPSAPGDAMPPAIQPPPTNESQPAAPPPANAPALPNPAPPPNATGGSGAPASAPPPNATPGGTPPSAPPPR
ncbi:MAG TPA: hypothetical protein VGO61_00705 [Steroidobacteraceae bacterium]|jgi:hypothetical protein|nr:hypothetical protein [Steroidobacteraceae bacterium]